MPTLLHLDSSPLETSISRELAREYVKVWKTARPDSVVTYRDLAANPPPPIDGTWVQAQFTPPDARTPQQAAAIRLSDELVGELERADEYVLSVPMHNFAIPSVLKLWIDQIVRNGRTFSYSEKGAEGLLKGKKATVIVAAGGIYTAGTPAAAINFIDPYLKHILGFVGVTNVEFIDAGGASKVMRGAVDRSVFMLPLLNEVRTKAA